MDNVTGARTPLTTPSPSRSLDSDWIMNLENDIFWERKWHLFGNPTKQFCLIVPSAFFSSWKLVQYHRPPSWPSWQGALLFILFFSLTFLSIFTALLVGRADEEQFWNFFCDSLTVRNFYAESNSWLFLHLKLVKPRARPKVNQWHLFAIKTFWSLYIDQRHWYVCLKNCTLINLKVTDLKSQCPDWWKWWVSTSGRSMDWERKNVSRWIFFEIGRW